MRLLHTSDWHLGRTLHGVSLHEAQSAVLDRICELVEDPPDGVPVDAVLVAGDVYDRGVPPVESVQLFEWTLSPAVGRDHRRRDVGQPRLGHPPRLRLRPLPRPHPHGHRPGRPRPAAAARGQRRRAGCDLRHSLPRPRPRASCAGPVRRGAAALAPGGRRGGVRPHPGRSRRPRVRGAQRGARPRLRRGRRAERLRALHHGRRGRPGGRHRLRGHRLCRSGPPARAAVTRLGRGLRRALQRLAPALLLLGAGPHQGRAPRRRARLGAGVGHSRRDRAAAAHGHPARTARRPARLARALRAPRRRGCG